MRTTTRFLITLALLITTTASAWAQVKKVPGDSNPGTGIGGVTIIDTPAADPNAFTKGDDGKWTLAEFPAYTAKLNIQYEALPTITLHATPEDGGTLACTVEGKEQTYAEAGQTVTLTATPQDGYMLKSLTVSTPPTELAKNDAWDGDATALSAADLPGFKAVSEDAAKAWTGAPESGIAYLIFDFTESGAVKYFTFYNGSPSSSTPSTSSTKTRNGIYSDMNGHSDKYFYTTGGPGTAVTLMPDATDQTKYTFQMPDADVTVEAEFAELPSITFAAQNDNTIQSGKATVKVGTEDANVGDDGKLSGLHEGDQVTVTAKEGYKFRKAEAQQGTAAPTTVSFTVKRVAGVNYNNYTDGNYTVAPGTTWQQFIDSGEAPACLSIGVGAVLHDFNNGLQDCGGTKVANTADKKFVKPDDAIIDGATYGCNDYLGYEGHD